MSGREWVVESGVTSDGEKRVRIVRRGPDGDEITMSEGVDSLLSDGAPALRALAARAGAPEGEQLDRVAELVGRAAEDAVMEEAVRALSELSRLLGADAVRRAAALALAREVVGG